MNYFSKFDEFEAKIWGNFLKRVSGFENVPILGILRVVSLPITLFSCLISGLLASLYGLFDWDLFLVCSFGLLLAHSASNIFNDLWDYKNKIDLPDYFRNVYGVHPVYLFGERKTWILGFFVLLLAFLCGFYLFLERGIFVLVLAVLGFIFLFSYSGPPFKFKYKGLGELVVFLVWGPLMIAGSFWVITSKINPEVIILSFPYGITASLILFGKHLDKIKEDEKKGVKTLPVILGEEKTKNLCKILILLPYFFVVLGILLTKKLGLIFTFLSFPRALRIFNSVALPKPNSENELPEFYPRQFWPMWYVGGAFIFNTDFALSYIIALAISHFF
jgi:1,4-dihydroxy-2-naphthoate octaprenyltransferase